MKATREQRPLGATILLGMTLALGAFSTPAQAYVLLGVDWTYQPSPMGEDFRVCTTSFPGSALDRTKDGAAAWDYGGLNLTFGSDSCLSSGNYAVFNNVNQFDFGSGLGGSTLAEATYWFSGGNIIECDIRMNSSFSWYTGTGSPGGGQFDWQTVATHEFGHCIGLGHSGETSAIMYASVSSGVAKRTPTSDDLDGRNAMYGALCGNGFVDTGEECDDGNAVEDDGCSSACIACGNSVVTAPETCDDGNLTDGDGCSSTCTTECLAAPSVGCEEGFAKGKLLIKDTSGKEKMIMQWKKGPDLLGTDFGNPLSAGGSAYSLCLYDDGDALVADYVIARAGDNCSGKSCWKSVGIPPPFPTHKGYAFKDGDGTSDGINKITLKGPRSASIKIQGKNNSAKGLNNLPTGVAAALLGTTSATAQLNVADTGECFSIDLDVIKKSDGTNFQAQK